MRSVRCDVCGTKALMAASKCPKCGHGFEVRDGFGELLPLSHCSTCDSFYPERIGSCRWCGTKPDRAPIGPYIWKGVGIAAFAAMAVGAWLVRGEPTEEVSKARLAAVLKPDSSSTDSVISTGTLAVAPVDSSSDTASTGVVAADSTMQEAGIPVAAIDSQSTGSTPTTVVSIDSAQAPAAEPVAQPVAPPTVQPEPVASPAESRAVSAPPRTTRVVKPPPARSTSRTLARATARTPTRVAPKTPPRVASSTPKPTAKAPAARPRTRAAWVNSVSRNWVVVRAGASRGSRVIASIGPNTRVQLGESRGGWRRIRAKGLAGWVEHRSFFATAGAGRKAGSLAAR